MEIIKTHHGKETLRTIKFMGLFRHFFAINTLVFFFLPSKKQYNNYPESTAGSTNLQKCLNWALGQIKFILFLFNRKHHWSYGHNLLSNTVDLFFSYKMVNN